MTFVKKSRRWSMDYGHEYEVISQHGVHVKVLAFFFRFVFIPLQSTADPEDYFKLADKEPV